MLPSINPEDPSTRQEFLSFAVDATSVNPEKRKAAEGRIATLQNQVDVQLGFTPLLLNLTQSRENSAFFSILLKNTIKSSWVHSAAEHCIQVPDKDYLKENIVKAVLHTPDRVVRRNLSAAIGIIAESDFPTQWPTALNDILQLLGDPTTATLQQLEAGLDATHSILMKYRDQSDFTEDYVEIMRSIYTAFILPLIHTMHFLIKYIKDHGAQIDPLAYSGLLHIVECFQDITTLDLGNEFLSNIESICTCFHDCLSLNGNSDIHGNSSAYNVALTELKAEVISCLGHFINSFDEDFAAYSKSLVEGVWISIKGCPSPPTVTDEMVIRGLQMLSSACRGCMRSYFDDTMILQGLVSELIIPNLVIQEEDMENFDIDPEAFIQKDIEGSDMHTRRRAAVDFIRCLITYLPEKSGTIFTAELGQISSFFSVDGKMKDKLIYLVTALAVKGHQIDPHRKTPTELSTLVDLNSFLQIIFTELSSPVSENSPLLVKADCIKFIATFRDYIPTASLSVIIPSIVKWLSHENLVIYTYCANALERLIHVQKNGIYVISEDAVANYIPSILKELCIRTEKSEGFNAYGMMCLLGLCTRFRQSMKNNIEGVICSMNKVLFSAAKNPSNPLFNHCLFEVISNCILIVPEKGEFIEQIFWTNIINILSDDVIEYIPYALQILGQLLDLHPKASLPPEHYRPILEPLLNIELLRYKGNIPAVVRLLSSYVRNYPLFIQQGSYDGKVLNVFHYLVQSKLYDHEGLAILTEMIIHYPKDSMGNYMRRVFELLLQRLEIAKTPKYVRILVIFISISIRIFGATYIEGCMNNLQPNLFFLFMEKVWFSNMNKVTGVIERKSCVVAAVDILTECPSLYNNPAFFCNAVLKCLSMIHIGADQDDHTSFSPAVNDINNLSHTIQSFMEVGFTNVFTPLHGVKIKSIDVCASIQDPELYFREKMKAFLNGTGKSLSQNLATTLPPDALALIN